MKFSSFDISKEMIDSLKSLKIFDPTQIQKEVIPKALRGKNIVGISDTGSGKTLAFLVPILERITNDDCLQAVIISPTRELATQLYDVCFKLAKIYNPHISVKKFIGGTSKSSSNINCHIAIGTPGRIHDLFIQENILRVDKTSAIVIDEADMVFEDNYLEQIDEIKSRINKDIQYMVFSATINENLAQFFKKYLKHTAVIDCSSKKGINPNISHVLLKSRFGRKDDVLLKLLKCFNPYTCLIFASNKKEVERLYYLISENGYKCGLLHGDLDARKRKRVVNDILNDKYQYIVASDIASRGLDLTMVTHIINYDLPRETVFYSHRSGRSGRYDACGISYVLYDEKDLHKISQIKSMGIEFDEYTIKNGELVKDVRRKYKKREEVVVGFSKKELKTAPNAKKKRKAKVAKIMKEQRKKNWRKKRWF